MNQLDLPSSGGPNCDYYRHGPVMSCGSQRLTPGGKDWSGPLCAKCDEIRSWLKGYMAKESAT